MNNLGQSKCLDQVIDQINKNLDDRFNKSVVLDPDLKCDGVLENVFLMTNLEENNLLTSDHKIHDLNLDHFKMNEHKSTANSQNDKLVNNENISKDNNELSKLTSIKEINSKLIDKSADHMEENLIDQELPSPSPSLLNCNLSTDIMVDSVKSINQENGQDNLLKSNCSIENRKCQCKYVPRYSHLIHELPSFKTALAQNDDHLSNQHNHVCKEQKRFQSILHLIQSPKEQPIAQLDAIRKQLSILSNTMDQTKCTNFESILESNKQPSISNDYYLDMSRSALPNLIQNCLNGNDALLIQAGSSESHDVLLGPTGLFQYAVNWLFDGLKKLHRKSLVRCTAAQFDTEQLIDLFAKHRLSKAPSKSSRFLNSQSILNHLYEIRCSNLKKSAQAIELAINNNRKLLNLTSSNENILLITFHVYQYEVKQIVNSNRKTAIGGCSRFHLLDISTNLDQTSCILNSFINDNLNSNQPKLSSKDQRTNKIWPKFNDESNKISELFQEFLANPTCSISLVGSFENNKINYNQINTFCGLTEQFHKFKYYCKNNLTACEKDKKDDISDHHISKTINRRSSIRCQLRNLGNNQNNSNSLPRRLSKYSNSSKKSNEEYKESLKKIVLKRKNLQVQSQSQTEIWIDGPKCELNDNEEELLSINNSSIDFTIFNEKSLKNSSNNSRSNELVTSSDDLISKQKRIENWIKQQQMADKVFRANDRLSSKLSNNKKANCHLDDSYLNNAQVIEDKVLDKYASLSSHLNNLYNTISKRTNQNELNDFNQNSLVANLNFKESPFKYLSKNSLNRKDKGRLCALKTNYQEQFKLTCSSEDDWSSREDDEDEENEQKLIEENLHFFNTNFFKRNFQISSALSDDGSTYLDDQKGNDLVLNKKIVTNQHNLQTDLENKKDKIEDRVDIDAEPPKQLKLEQFLKQLVNSTIDNQADLRESLNNLSSVTSSPSSAEKSNTKCSNKLNQIEPNKQHSKCFSTKTNNSNASSSSSSGIHLSSSKDTNKHLNYDTINSKMDLNSIKSNKYGYKEKSLKNVNKNSSVTSSGHGTISETESGEIRNCLIEQKSNKNFVAISNSELKAQCKSIVHNQPKYSAKMNITMLKDKIDLADTSENHEIKNNSEIILNSNNKIKSAICKKSIKETKKENLFCCGLF